MDRSPDNSVNLLALKLFPADPANVDRRVVVLVDVEDMVLEVRLSCEAHGAALDGALINSFVRVLPQVLAQ